jgi:hypothetical protein
MENNQTEASVLNVGQRRKRGMQLRRRKSRIKFQRARIMRRFADKGRIQKRAQRGARNMFKKRFAGGKSYSSLSPAQKITVDRRTSKFTKAISRVSKRLVPKLRRKEMQRKRGPAREELDLDFQDMFVENHGEPEMDGLDMAEGQLYEMAEDSIVIAEIMSGMEEEPDEWILAKITLAADYLSTVRDVLEYYSDEDDEDDEDEDDEYDEDEADYEEYEYESDIIESILSLDKKDLSIEELDALGDFFEEYGSLKKKSESSNIPFDIVLEVYDRGMGDELVSEGNTQKQHAFARVNSFIADGNTDPDLQEKVLEFGTDDARIAYANDTPGQNPDYVTMKYDVGTVLQVMNNINTQRIKKIHEGMDEDFDTMFKE